MNNRKLINMSVINAGPVLNDELRSKLSLQFTHREIQEAMWSIPDGKAPGLDGYNSKFYKEAWSIVGKDVVAAIQSFFRNGKLLQAWSNTAVTLVPKVSCPTTPGDFRPIACCHTIYKCIFKLVCSRLATILRHLISPNQRAFVSRRSIIRNILLCQDFIRHYSRKHCSPSCLIKADLRKAYDTIEWHFIKDMLIALGGNHFVKIITTCLTSTTFSPRGEWIPLKFLKAKRGL